MPTEEVSEMCHSIKLILRSLFVVGVLLFITPGFGSPTGANTPYASALDMSKPKPTPTPPPCSELYCASGTRCDTGINSNCVSMSGGKCGTTLC